MLKMFPLTLRRPVYNRIAGGAEGGVALERGGGGAYENTDLRETLHELADIIL
jgi:hypothetical protein